MFTHDMVEAKQDEICMQGIDPKYNIYNNFKYIFTSTVKHRLRFVRFSKIELILFFRHM